ncbi:MAG: hypothetical protein EZS28_029359, partial [Streblomastix strix]
MAAGANEVVEMGAQPMWKHKGSQRKLERLCKITREENRVQGKVHFRDELEKELRGEWSRRWIVRKSNITARHIWCQRKEVSGGRCWTVGSQTRKRLKLILGWRELVRQWNQCKKEILPQHQILRVPIVMSPAIFSNVLKPVIKETREIWTQKVYFGSDEVPGGVGLVAGSRQMLNESEQGVRISGLGVEFGEEAGLHSEVETRITEKEHQELDGVDIEGQKDQSHVECSNLRGVELFEDLVRGCIFISECNQQVENKSVKGGRLERE